MFNIEFLHTIREFEYKRIISMINPGSKLLEIGGGTGYQAKRFSEDGFQVESIDLAESIYSGSHVFPVKIYDGLHIPFPDDCFDVVFSSNVLEHVKDLAALHTEIKRVLKPGGYGLHVMPTGTWRFWTIVTHYLEFFQRFIPSLLRLIPQTFSRLFWQNTVAVLKDLAGIIKQYAFVCRHGETGNVLTEIFTFCPYWWINKFKALGCQVEHAIPTGLFYTGYMFLGDHLSLSKRKKLAKLLGSACWIYQYRIHRSL